MLKLRPHWLHVQVPWLRGGVLLRRELPSQTLERSRCQVSKINAKAKEAQQKPLVIRVLHTSVNVIIVLRCEKKTIKYYVIVFFFSFFLLYVMCGFFRVKIIL